MDEPNQDTAASGLGLLWLLIGPESELYTMFTFLGYSLGQLLDGIAAGCFAVAIAPFAVVEMIRKRK